MTRMMKQVCVILGLAVLAGCATAGGEGGSGTAQTSAAKVAAADCTNRADAARQTCEQGCPTATGREHFSVQHKIARENLECKEQCVTTRDQQVSQCSAQR